MKLALTGREGDYSVWAMLDDPDFHDDPTQREESFVIGTGATVEEALADARKELLDAADTVAMIERPQTQAEFYPRSRYGSKL